MNPITKLTEMKPKSTKPFVLASTFLVACLSLNQSLYAQTKQEVEAAKRIVQTTNSTTKKPAVNLADKFNSEGLMQIRAGNLAQAEQLLRIAVKEARLQGSTQPLATSLTNLGIAYGRQAKWDLSEQAFKEAIAIKEASFGQTSAPVASTLQHYASMLRDAKRETEALTIEARARQILSGKPERTVVTTTHNLNTTTTSNSNSGTNSGSRSGTVSTFSIETNDESRQSGSEKPKTSELVLTKSERLGKEAAKLENFFQKKIKESDNKADVSLQEYEQALNAADAIMANIPQAQQARGVLAVSKQHGLAYRKKLDLFLQAGGCDPKSIKSRDALLKRIKQAQELNSSFKNYQQACQGFFENANNATAERNKLIMDIESKLLAEFSFQLKFLDENWGRWKWDHENRLQMWVPKAQITLYNNSIDRAKDLADKQQLAIKVNANQTLQRLETLKKKL